MCTPIHVHAIERRSRANGPGARYVVWFQGCSLGCPGCFNPGTHDPGGGGDSRTVADVVADIVAQGDAIEGVTLSGGEPFEQPQAALELVRAVRSRSALSILIFSGYAIDELRAMPLGPDILAHIDVLVDGRFQAPQRLGRGLRGSTNQRIHLLSDRYRQADVEATPEAEIRIEADGRIVLTGVDPLRLGRRDGAGR
ncbi:4Fe-4S single cluster domain-containing protein [Haliangium sp.]|uniref:4Fe-4S single cluster domain-containing protein n=1 Tax=Haliangium sp. TaxID=2663208 RepID=UPI003D0BF9D4